MNTNQVSLALAVALVNRTGYNEIGSVSSRVLLLRCVFPYGVYVRSFSLLFVE